ncbi:PAS domain S-box protein [Svornostia abyssi]|uniref:PAS domain S-box protein n=1 Tax=Svornostia abyssi TaxID=2898438 RepID=A0ABY5PLK5_9ACTN|nr:PAS domain S-box protein [Parviterribacteraceae bacterium J379]
MADTDRDDIEQFWELGRELFCVLADDATFLRVNPAWTRVLGWREDELLGRPAFEFVHPDDLAATRHVSIAEGGEGQQLEEFQNRYRHKDGSVRWLNWTGYKRGDRWYGMARDVTATRMSHDALQRSERRSRAVLEALREGLVVIDSDRRVVEINQRFGEMVGWTPREVVGSRPPYPWWPPEERAHIGETLAQSLKGKRRTLELTFMHRDGRRFPVIIDEADLPERSGRQAVLSVVRDVSELVGTRDRLAEAHRVADLNSWEWYPERDYVIVYEDPLSSGPQSTYEMDGETSLAGVAEPFRSELRRLRDETAQGLRGTFALDLQTGEPDPGRWIEIRGEQILDPAGKVIGVRGTAQEITARKRAELEARLQSDVLEAIDVAVVARGPDGRIVHVNGAVTRMLGWTREELIGAREHDVRIIAQDQPEAVELNRALRAGETWEGDLDLLCRDGARMRAHVRTAVVRDDTGTPQYAAGIIVPLAST